MRICRYILLMKQVYYLDTIANALQMFTYLLGVLTQNFTPFLPSTLVFQRNLITWRRIYLACN